MNHTSTRDDLYSSEPQGSETNHMSIRDNEQTPPNRQQETKEENSSDATEAKDIENLELSPYAGPDEGIADPKDLARNRLPSSCIFVAKFDFLFYPLFFNG